MIHRIHSIERDLSLDIESFKQAMCKEYKYIESSKIKKKYTVTELKKELGKESIKNISIEGSEKTKKEIMPKALMTEVDSMSYGTFIHKILEKLDLKELDISKQSIEKLARDIVYRYENFGEQEISKVVNMVYGFLNSDAKKYLSDATKIEKELEYLSLSNLSEFPELGITENTLVQGIIDLYIETKDGKKIIIDFKTDRVKEEKELIDRYKYQLLIYMQGLENISGSKIDNIYIYSFELAKLIDIN